MTKFNCLVGGIVSGFVRTEYLLSQIVSELGLSNYRTELFSDPRTAQKFRELIRDLHQSDISRKQEYISLISDFSGLCEERNMVVHSLVLTNASNENEFMFHNYLKVKNGILNKSKTYTISDLDDLKNRIVEIHNQLWNLHFKKEA